MRGLSGRVVVLLVSVVAMAAGDASARTIRRLCRDGVIGIRTDRSGNVTTACDVDHQCDGICSFELPVCDATTCETQTFAVPVRSRRPERMALTPGAGEGRAALSPDAALAPMPRSHEHDDHRRADDDDRGRRWTPPTPNHHHAGIDPRVDDLHHHDDEHVVHGREQHDDHEPRSGSLPGRLRLRRVLVRLRDRLLRIRRALRTDLRLPPAERRAHLRGRRRRALPDAGRLPKPARRRLPSLLPESLRHRARAGLLLSQARPRTIRIW
jgi:hypothetical protein